MAVDIDDEGVAIVVPSLLDVKSIYLHTLAQKSFYLCG